MAHVHTETVKVGDHQSGNSDAFRIPKRFVGHVYIVPEDATEGGAMFAVVTGIDGKVKAHSRLFTEGILAGADLEVDGGDVSTRVLKGKKHTPKIVVLLNGLVG